MYLKREKETVERTRTTELSCFVFALNDVYTVLFYTVQKVLATHFAVHISKPRPLSVASDFKG